MAGEAGCVKITRWTWVEGIGNLFLLTCKAVQRREIKQLRSVKYVKNVNCVKRMHFTVPVRGPRSSFTLARFRFDVFIMARSLGVCVLSGA